MENNSPLIHPPQTPAPRKNDFAMLIVPILVLVGVMLAGYFAGSLVAKAVKPGQKTSLSGEPTVVASEKGEKEGILDKSKFPDSAEGVLREGGFEDEGSFNLERPGGPSQTVYLTSTVVDLSEYVGKKVKVYGQTYKGKKAGWLMDVGYVEVI